MAKIYVGKRNKRLYVNYHTVHDLMTLENDMLIRIVNLFLINDQHSFMAEQTTEFSAVAAAIDEAYFCVGAIDYLLNNIFSFSGLTKR